MYLLSHYYAHSILFLLKADFKKKKKKSLVQDYAGLYMTKHDLTVMYRTIEDYTRLYRTMMDYKGQ